MASRRDYTKIAGVILNERNTILKSLAETVDPTVAVAASSRRIAQNLAEVFAADNPRFDKAKFLRACGVR